MRMWNTGKLVLGLLLLANLAVAAPVVTPITRWLNVLYARQNRVCDPSSFVHIFFVGPVLVSEDNGIPAYRRSQPGRSESDQCEFLGLWFHSHWNPKFEAEKSSSVCGAVTGKPCVGFSC